MDMTKSDVCQFLTRGTKNAHCTTCAFIPYAGFSQIRSHIVFSLPLFQPTASVFIIALQCQPRLSLVDYLGGSRKPHPQNVIINHRLSA